MKKRSTAPFRQWSKRRKKLVHHRRRNVATIEAVFRFLRVFPKVLVAHMNVGSDDRPLELREEALQPVHRCAGNGVGILAAIVVHANVAVAGVRNILIAAHFVGADR